VAGRGKKVESQPGGPSWFGSLGQDCLKWSHARTAAGTGRWEDGDESWELDELPTRWLSLSLKQAQTKRDQNKHPIHQRVEITWIVSRWTRKPDAGSEDGSRQKKLAALP